MHVHIWFRVWFRGRAVAVAFLFACMLSVGVSAEAETRLDVEIPSTTGGQPLSGILFVPDGGAPKPAVIVLHTAYGQVEPADEAYARDLARNGFVALAVNYLTNTVKNSRWSPRITSELVGAVNWLRARPEVAGNPVGTVGFSLGSHGILLGARHSAVRAMVVYYGAYNVRKYAKSGQNIPANLPLPIDAAPNVAGAVLLLHGEKDDEISVRDAEETRDALAAAGKTVDLVVYPGAYHRFDRGPVPGSNGEISAHGFTYREDPAAAENAFARTLAWLENHLVSASPPAAGAPATVAPAAAEPVGPTGRTPSQVIAGSDKDGNAMLSKAEFKGPPAAFSSLDADKDGFLTKEELINAWK